MKKKSSTICPVCKSQKIIEFKEYIFCKECRKKYKKTTFEERGSDRIQCPECGSLKTMDLISHVYCRECEVKYDKKEYYPYWRLGYYYCPRCDNKDLEDQGDEVYCDKCELSFLKVSLRTMKNGEEKEVWSVGEGMGVMSALDPEKKGYKTMKEEMDKWFDE